MNCVRVLVGVLAFAGAALAAGATDPKPTEEKKAPVQKVAVFDMAEVMRDFHQVKHHSHLMSKRKDELCKPLMAYRDEYIKLVKEIERPSHTRPNLDDIVTRMRELARKIEAEDDKVSKQLKKETDDANRDFHEKIKTVVNKVVEINGYQLAPVSDSAGGLKELKLKPPPAQPFYVAPRIDITRVVVKTLNAWYPAFDEKRQVILDYSTDPPCWIPITKPPPQRP